MTAPAHARELVLTRFIPAPPSLVYRAWTDPDLLLRWFTPAPWKTTKAVLDVRAGGSNLKEGERGTRRAYGTGRNPIAKRTRTWAFTMDGEPRPISWSPRFCRWSTLLNDVELALTQVGGADRDEIELHDHAAAREQRW